MAGFASTQGLILWREALRISRGRRTYLLRVFVSLVLLAVFWLGYWSATGRNLTDSVSGTFGYYTFVALSLGSMGLGAVLVAILAIQGVHEEQEQDMLPLLAMTQLTPRSLLWSKVGAQIILLLTILAGALPIGALSLYFGGVSPFQVCLWAYNLLLTVLLIGGVASLVSFSSRNVALPFLAVLGYGVSIFFILPIVAAVTLDAQRLGEPLLLLSPFFFMVESDARSFLPGLFIAPVLVRLWFVGGRLLRNRVDRGIRDRGPIWTGWPCSWIGHVFFLGPVGIVGYWGFHKKLYGFNAHDVPIYIHVIVFAAFLYSFTMLYLRVSIWGIRRLAFGSFFRWILDGINIVGRSSPTGHRKPFRFFPLWGNPVTWREMFTHGNGASGRVLIVMAVFWFVVVMSAIYGSGGSALYRIQTWETASFVAFYLSHISAASLITASVVQERQEGTLSLLQVSTFSMISLAMGKALATFLRTAPLWVFAVGVWTLATILFPHRNYSNFQFNFFFPFGGLLTLLAWMTAIHFTIILWGLLMGLILPKARMAWLVNIGGTLLFPMMIGGVEITLSAFESRHIIGRYSHQRLTEILMPIGDKHWVAHHGATWEMLVAIVVWTYLAFFAFAVSSLWLRNRTVR